MDAFGANNRKPEDSYHVITTDNALFESLGMSAFTTGTMWEFLTHKDGDGVNNFRYFSSDAVGSLPLPSDMGFIFTADGAGDLAYWMESYDPKTNKHASISEDKDILNNWQFFNKSDTEYSSVDLPNLSDMKTYSSSTKLDPNSAKEWREDSLVHSDVFGGGNGEIVAQKVIEMNNWVRLKKQKEGKKVVTEWSDEGSVSAEDAIAAFYWIADIKSSKRGGLEWVSRITFNLTPGLDTSDPEACLKTELVTFKLRLFDNNVPRDSTRAIIQKAPLAIAAVPQSEFGPKGKREDGQTVDETTETVQPLDIISDSISGKGRSGSLQIIAKLTTPLPAAKDEIDVDDIKDKDSNGDDDFNAVINGLYEKFLPGSGEAMPLQAQNKNPNQWTPVWSNPKCNSEEKNTPELINVKNFSKRSYEKDKTVLLNQLGGSPGSKNVVWCVIDFGDEATEAVSQTFEGKWDFTYLMANGDHYFRKWEPNQSTVQGTHDSFKNTFYERQFLHQYYSSITDTLPHLVTKEDAKLNWSNTDNALGPDSADPTKAKEIEFCVAPRFDGFYQITSWDFMHQAIGGTRGTHNSIVQTNALLDYAGKGYEERDEEPEEKNGTEQLPFFGAVFPDGYDIGSINSYKDTDITFKAVENGDGFWNVGSAGKPFGDSLTSNGISSATEGMFTDTLISAGLPHFPADMALHASISGENGSPISSVNWMKAFMTLKPLGVGSLYSDTIKYFEANKRYSYLIKDNDDEAFDLLPTNKSKVQFRPLMAETYLSFVGTGPGGTNPNNNPGYTTLAQNAGGNYEVMLTMSQKGWNSQNGKGTIKSPISPVFLTRNDLTVIDKDINEQGPKASHSLKYGVVSNGKFPDEVWGNQYTTAGGSTANATAPANAVGVIGAVCTVKSVGSNSLSFDVGCNIGIQNGGGTTRGGGFNSIGGIIGGIFGGGSNISIGPDRTSDEVYYWGNSLDNPEKFFTTNLHARVFNAWPRDLTVYDTRFYAVHHFNYGVGQELDDIGFDVHHKGKAVETSVLLGDGFEATSALATHIMGGGRMDPGTANSLYVSSDIDGDAMPDGFQDNQYNNAYVGEEGVYYPVDKIGVENADFREPTYSNRPGTTTGAGFDNTFVPPEVDIFKDSPLRAASEWRVNSKARGKLLPFKYNRRTIGVGKAGSTIYDVKDRTPDPPVGTLVSAAKIVTESVGKGYQSGDTFTTSGGGGTGVVLKLVTYDPGSNIFDLEIVNPGKDFRVDAFLKESDVVSKSTASSVKIVPLSLQSGGTGFKGWITFGEVVNTVEEIAKPADCGETLISPATKSQGYINVNGYRQFLTWGDDKRASDDMYDVFLYFHNDIGHTLAYVPDYGTPPFTSRQQWMNVTVLPN